MTDGPPVTVIDPHARPTPALASRATWSHAERALALVTATVLVVAVAAARHLSASTADSGLTAVGTRHTVVVATPSSFRLDVAISGAAPDVDGVQAIRPDAGWVLESRSPTRLGNGTRLTLTHAIGCDGPVLLPSLLQVVTADRSLRVRVHVQGIHQPASTCDPLPGPEAVRVVTSTVTHGSRTRVRIGLVDVSTQPRTLSTVSFAGFSFAATTPLPLPLPGRDRRRPLSVGELVVKQLDLVADVARCDLARPALDRAAASSRPDLLGAVVDGVSVQLHVAGLEAYLELRWQDTCVR
ncbi:MAG: hypothetical protein ABR549_14445 [Mycobacteriales bacterium]